MVSSAWTYVYRGDPARRSRLHNHRGVLIDARGLAHLPHSVATTIRLKLTGHRPELPWLGYRAIRRLDELLQPDWRVLELGSGMSTLWLARRCCSVLSLETDDMWFRTVTDLLQQAGLNNVDLRLCAPSKDGPDYREGMADRVGDRFDLALVDGARRDRGVEVALAAVRPGGYVLLDNSDLQEPTFRTALALLRKGAGESPEVTVFNDLCPGLVMVNEATLARLPAESPAPPGR